jgi:hypothetical protein
MGEACSMTERDQPPGRRKAERRKLEAAGWEAKSHGAKTIWRSPADGRWYAHHQAVKMLSEEGPSPQEAHLLDEHGFERVSDDGTADGRERWSRLEEGALRVYTRSKALIKARRETPS